MFASSRVSQQVVRRCNSGVDVLAAEEPETRRVTLQHHLAVLHVLLSLLTLKGRFQIQMVTV